jgi:hypothetical protein
MTFPELYQIGQAGSLDRMNPASEYDGDPRGIVWCMEPPSKSSKYVMGIDPSLGRTGWNRFNRVKEDRKTNNGAIEIIRIGKDSWNKDGTPQRSPDVQVCEYAAPVDPFELAYVANLLGRLYAGSDDDQCECILEVYPGPGGMTLRQLVDLGYTNLWRWQYYAELNPGAGKSIGWTATSKSVRDLWVKSSRHLILQRVRILSPFLVEEYADARMNDVKGYAESISNEQGHGDRMRAFNLALWAGNKWDLEVERTEEYVTTGPAVEFQCTDMSMDEIQNRWGECLDRMGF